MVGEIRLKLPYDLDSTLSGIDSGLKEAIKGLVEQRIVAHGRRGMPTERAIRLMIAKLNALYPGNVTMQIASVDQSTQAGYLGVFIVKPDNMPQPVLTEAEKQANIQRFDSLSNNTAKKRICWVKPPAWSNVEDSND